jgi:hypothetical protein
MGSFSVWHWVIVGIIIFVPLYFLYFVIKKKRSEPKGKENLKGVGGWLAFLVFSLMFLGPLISVGRLASEFEKLERLSPDLLNRIDWSNYKITSWSMLAVGIAITFSAGYRLLKHHRPGTIKFVIWCLWGTWIGLLFADVIATISIFNLSLEAILPGLVKGVIASSMASGLWTWYLKKSVRVKNTYQTWSVFSIPRENKNELSDSLVPSEEIDSNAINKNEKWWRRKSKAFRMWTFFSLVWIILLTVYLFVMEPYGYRMRNDDLSEFLFFLFFPPIFVGGVYFGYNRFVR